MTEIPEEIVRLRARLAELEQIASAHAGVNRALRAGTSPPEQPEVEQPSRGFNEAFRRAAGQAPAEAEPETPTTEPEPPATVTRGVQAGPIRQEGFNETLRRLRGFTE